MIRKIKIKGKPLEKKIKVKNNYFGAKFFSSENNVDRKNMNALHNIILDQLFIAHVLYQKKPKNYEKK